MAGAWRIGDALTLSRDLADDSVDCIVTSPPYWGLRSYLADDDPAKAQEMGAEPTLSEYVDRLVTLFRELRRALKPEGTCWLNLGDSYNGGSASSGGEKGSLQGTQNRTGVAMPAKRVDGLKPKDLCLVPYRVALALQADGWYLRSHIIWAKPNPMPESVTDRPTSAHEAVFMLTKSARYWYDADAVREESVSDSDSGNGYARAEQVSRGGRGQASRWTRAASGGVRNKRNVWSIPSAPYSGSHYAVMPPKLIEPCIKAGCPPKVCDVCGSPWVRMAKRISAPMSSGAAIGGDPARKDAGVRERAPTGSGGGNRLAQVRAWGDLAPTCDHDAGTRPGLVLDPFGGSGTVGMVAESLGRDWLMFDLDERNAALMAQRTAQRSLLGLMG